MAQDYVGVVFDTGSQTTKAGFAGEGFPRAVFPTTVGRFRRPGIYDSFTPIYCGREAILKRGLSRITCPVEEGFIKNWDDMEKLWHHTFYKELHVAPEGSRVMHSVHPLVSSKDKEKMAEVLFENFAIKALYIMKSPVLVLHASGRTTGLVCENGYSCSYVVPVYEGFPLIHSAITSPLSGKLMTSRLQKLLSETGYTFTTPIEIEILDKMKAECCYIAEDFDEEMISSSRKGDNKTIYKLPDGQTILLGEERFKCPEVLFNPLLAQLDCPNLVDMICTSISQCDIDYRAMFYDNIVLGGGSTLFPGLVARLEAEFALKQKTQPLKVQFDAMPSRNFAAWLGGSVVSSLSIHKGFWMTLQEYEDVGANRVNYKFL